MLFYYLLVFDESFSKSTTNSSSKETTLDVTISKNSARTRVGGDHHHGLANPVGDVQRCRILCWNASLSSANGKIEPPRVISRQVNTRAKRHLQAPWHTAMSAATSATVSMVRLGNLWRKSLTTTIFKLHFGNGFGRVDRRWMHGVSWRVVSWRTVQIASTPSCHGVLDVDAYSACSSKETVENLNFPLNSDYVTSIQNNYCIHTLTYNLSGCGGSKGAQVVDGNAPRAAEAPATNKIVVQQKQVQEQQQAEHKPAQEQHQAPAEHKHEPAKEAVCIKYRSFFPQTYHFAHAIDDVRCEADSIISINTSGACCQA